MSPKANVLVVDDSPSNRQMLKTCLNRAGYETVSADNGRKGLTLARRMPDVILLDVMMPEMDGIEMCQRLQDDPKTAAIPVIFLSARSEIRDKVAGLEAGAVDYITKPFNRREVLARLAAALRLKQNQDRLRRESLKYENDAAIDPLTGLWNRRRGLARLEEAVLKARNNHQSFVIGLLDVDDFKRVNDNQGHLAGDKVLRNVANALRCKARRSDTVCRYGGDEFLWGFQRAGIPLARRAAKRFQKQLNPLRGTVRNSSGRSVTVTIGLAEALPGSPDVSEDTSPARITESLIARADAHLLAGKRRQKGGIFWRDKERGGKGYREKEAPITPLTDNR